MSKLKTILVSCSATIALVAATQAARAADLAAPVVAPIAPVIGAFNIFEGVEFHAQGEVGILGNADNPSQGFNGEGYNFGHLYTDHANEPLFNNGLVTITKAIDPAAKGFSFGFTIQGLFGSDERFNHYLGIGDSVIKDRNQAGIYQAFVAAHLPGFTSGGTDVKVGLFASPQGYETTDPSTSPLYSHSYTYNYAVTFNHTGILTTTHVNSTVDFYLGVDTGNQTSFGVPNGDPNGQAAGFVGVGLNGLLDNKLTVLALSHIGPEGSFLVDPNANRNLRYYNDVVFTYKINDDWTSVTELNYLHDDFGYGPAITPNGANSYSAVQYFGYTFNKIYTLNVRGEIFRDANNFAVATFQDPLGLVKLQQGYATAFPGGFGGPVPGGTTYGGITLGLTIKPEVPKPLALVAIRPEIRYDRILAGAPLYNSATAGATDGSRNQFTFGGDIIIGF